MAFDFPNTPAEGAIYTPPSGPQYVFRNGVWMQTVGGQAPVLTARPMNYVVNPSMQISQENGDSGIAIAGGFGADQWALSFTAAAAMGLYRSPVIDMGYGPTTCLVFNVIAADTSIAASDHLLAHQYIEGYKVADLQWGTAYTKQAVLRFKARHSVAGIYCVSIRNSAANRTWIGEYTISAGEVNVPVERTLVIPGDTTGLWLRDNGIGIQLAFVVASGTTYHGVAGWQAGNKVATAGIANGMGVIGTHVITDVGFYIDPDNTGVPPPWERPDYDDVLRECQRYYWKSVHGVTLNTYLSDLTFRSSFIKFPNTMRTNAVMAATPSLGTIVGNTGTLDGTTITVSGVGAGNGCSASGIVANARF